MMTPVPGGCLEGERGGLREVFADSPQRPEVLDQRCLLLCHTAGLWGDSSMALLLLFPPMDSGSGSCGVVVMTASQKACWAC